MGRGKGKRRQGLIGVFVTLLPLASPSFLSAATDLPQGIGVVTAVQGEVTVDHPDPSGPVTVKLQDDVLFKDVIVTQKESRTKALLDNESLITVGENSRVEITEHLYDPKENKRSVVVKLLEGKLRALVGKVFSQAGNRFEIHTSSAVAAARGTYFVIWSEGGRSGVVNIGNSGRVDFSAGGQTVSIAPAQFSMALQGAAPAPPTPAAAPNAPAVVASVVQATVIPDSPKAESPGQLLRTITESRTRSAVSTSVDEKTSAASRADESKTQTKQAREAAKQKALQAQAEQELLKQQRAAERQAAREQARQLARLRQEQRQQARQERQLARARGEVPVRNMERAQRQTQVARLVASGDRQGAREALQFARFGRSLGAGGQQGRGGDASVQGSGIEQSFAQVQTGGDQGGGQGQGQNQASAGASSGSSQGQSAGQGQAGGGQGSGLGQPAGQGQGSSGQGGQGQGAQVLQSGAQGGSMSSAGSGTGGGSGSSASSGGGSSSQSGPIKSTFTSSPTAGPRIGVMATVTPPSNISGSADRIIFEDAVARSTTSSSSSSSSGSSSGGGSSSGSSGGSSSSGSSSSSSSSGGSSSSSTTTSSGSSTSTTVTSSGGTKGNLRESFTRGRRGR